jgi:hypothetical protein
MHERHKHLLCPMAPTGYVVLHDRDLAREAVLVLEALENALARVSRLLRAIPVGCQDGVNNAGDSSSFGRTGGFARTYPGGTENLSIFDTVLALMPNRAAAARSLSPSIKTACRTRA